MTSTQRGILSSIFHNLPQEEQLRVRDIIIRSCGVTPRTFYRWLNGIQPNKLQQEKISETLNIPRETLFPFTNGDNEYLELNVGFLKEVLSELPDDVLLADLEYGLKGFFVFRKIKKLLLLKDEAGNRYLTINRIGAHYTDNHKIIWGIHLLSTLWKK